MEILYGLPQRFICVELTNTSDGVLEYDFTSSLPSFFWGPLLTIVYKNGKQITRIWSLLYCNLVFIGDLYEGANDNVEGKIRNNFFCNL